MKYILMILILSGCSLNNVKSVFSKKDKGKLKESGFFSEKKEVPSSLSITATGNAQVNLGDKAMDVKLIKETKRVIKTDEAWDMTLHDAYESYSTFTYVFIGIGLLLIVCAIKRFEKTSVGRVFSSVNYLVANRLKHADPKSPEFNVLQSLQEDIEKRSHNHLGKG